MKKGGEIEISKIKYQISNLLLLLLVLVVGWGVFVRSVAADGELEFTVEEGMEATEATEKVEYELPWPGILPDHPLYRLKMLRDRIWGFLIRDPLRKSQWCLLMADKRIWASQMLMEKGKFNLAVTTATKAEKYLERAVGRAFQAEKMGKGNKTFFEKILKASVKHEEMLQDILAKVPDELKPATEDALDYPKRANQKTLILLEE